MESYGEIGRVPVNLFFMDVIKNMKCENCQRKSHRCKRENLRVDNFFPQMLFHGGRKCFLPLALRRADWFGGFGVALPPFSKGGKRDRENVRVIVRGS